MTSSLNLARALGGITSADVSRLRRQPKRKSRSRNLAPSTFARVSNYYVQTSVDDGEHWETIAAYEDIESAVAVAKSLRVEDPLTGDALRAAIVCDLEEMEDSYNLPYIDQELAAEMDSDTRARLDRVAVTERNAVTPADIKRFLYEP
jgi:hypothetical protein